MKVSIIAEIWVNFYDIAWKKGCDPLSAAKLMIEEAKRWGADVAKFQSYKAHTIASRHSPAYRDTTCEPTKSQHKLFQKFDKFGSKEYQILADHAKKVGIDFMSTPFDIEAVDFLDPLVDSFKVASADITNYPLLKKISQKGKPILLSTWASTQEEIWDAIHYIHTQSTEINITLLHCVLNYPTPYWNANLQRILSLKKNFPGFELGYSDHTLPDKWMSICTAAFVLWATVIEKHFTLDKSLQGNDHYHSMDVNDLIILKENVSHLVEGNRLITEDYLPEEEISRLHARRSIVLVRDLKKGDTINAEDLIMKRPGHWISPSKLEQVLHKVVKHDLTEDSILRYSDIINDENAS